ncbi:MAG TPA: hypothetical protein P5244_06655 [Syntrophales bacterium]|nr:hypothetical protein [Syntrophales bacterium]
MHRILVFSLDSVVKKKGYEELKKRLTAIVPDISNQYTTFHIAPENEFLTEKVRSLHTFQMDLLMRAVSLYGKETNRKIVHVVDIGDSSGTHLRYLRGLCEKGDVEIRSMSVNLDPEAVRRIEGHGLKAKMCRAEDLHLEEDGMRADIFVSFEMLEHLFDPVRFLYNLSLKSSCLFLVVTVPWVRESRVGLHHLRTGAKELVFAEKTHIFELAPRDWSLIFNFSGWEVILSERFLQYPDRGLLHLTKYLWRRKDFDGFWGAILRRCPEKTKQYCDW